MYLEIIATSVSIVAAIVSFKKAKDASDSAKELNLQLEKINKTKKIENRSNIMCNFEIIDDMVCFTVKNVGNVDAKKLKIRCKMEDDRRLYNPNMRNLMNKELTLKPDAKVKICLRPKYQALMSEMLEGHVPGIVDLKITYEDEFDKYDEEYRIYTTIFDSITIE